MRPRYFWFVGRKQNSCVFVTFVSFFAATEVLNVLLFCFVFSENRTDWSLISNLSFQLLNYAFPCNVFRSQLQTNSRENEQCHLLMYSSRSQWSHPVVLYSQKNELSSIIILTPSLNHSFRALIRRVNTCVSSDSSAHHNKSPRDIYFLWYAKEHQWRLTPQTTGQTEVYQVHSVFSRNSYMHNIAPVLSV